LACFDRQNDREGAMRQLFQAVQLSRRDLALYRNLGERLTELKQEKQAERAYTSIVEMQALEAESHTMLAEVREKQGRWPEAIEHWRRVADLRALEPTGLLRLAAAQIREKQWDAAAETVKTLRTKTWPPRFDKERERIRVLEKQVEAGRTGADHSRK
jgi:tetratricopeptide (TPR) repeat protein